MRKALECSYCEHGFPFLWSCVFGWRIPPASCCLATGRVQGAILPLVLCHLLARILLGPRSVPPLIPLPSSVYLCPFSFRCRNAPSAPFGSPHLRQTKGTKRGQRTIVIQKQARCLKGILIEAFVIFEKVSSWGDGGRGAATLFISSDIHKEWHLLTFPFKPRNLKWPKYSGGEADGVIPSTLGGGHWTVGYSWGLLRTKTEGPLTQNRK